VGPKYKYLEPKEYDVKNTTQARAKFSTFSCSTHPHNYYLELLSESGLIGTILMIIFFAVLLSKSYYCLKEYNRSLNTELIFLIPFIIVIFIDIWPLRSSGSFFTSGNATFFWLSVAIFLAQKRIKSN
jgi:O-antigen ligase